MQGNALGVHFARGCVGLFALVLVGLMMLGICAGSASAAVTETVGGVTNTWTNYTNAGGTEGPQIPKGQSVQITCRLTGFRVADGNTWWYQVASSPWNNAYYASADAFYNNGATSGSLQGTPFYDPAVPVCGSSGGGGTPPPTYNETVGGVTNTWTNYTNAGGTEGPQIPKGQSVQITCRLTGFTVADGNTWWYQIASSPWNGAYYASADAFYNNGATSGSLHGTPFYDPAVPVCASGGGPSGGGSGGGLGSGSSGPSGGGYTETVGGVTNTWANYANAGGNEGPQIASNQSVQVTCRLTGFAVADGDTWWYQVASSPWDNAYYASADAFYNNGATAGSLKGTPFYDPAVPVCSPPSSGGSSGGGSGGTSGSGSGGGDDSGFSGAVHLPAGDYVVQNAAGGIYWRSSPNWNTAIGKTGSGFYPGTVIRVICYESGDANVPGSKDTMWEQAAWVGGAGSGSGWINEHFINDGSPIDRPSPGAQPCGNSVGGSAGQWASILSGTNSASGTPYKVSSYEYCTTVPPMTGFEPGLPPSDWPPLNTGIKARVCMTVVDAYNGASAETRSIQAPACPSNGWFKPGSTLYCARTSTSKTRSGTSTVDSATVNLQWTTTSGFEVLVLDDETEKLTLTVRTAADGKHTTSSKVTNVSGWQTTEGDIATFSG